MEYAPARPIPLTPPPSQTRSKRWSSTLVAASSNTSRMGAEGPQTTAQRASLSTSSLPSPQEKVKPSTAALRPPPRKGVPARIRRLRAQLFLDPQELVVLRDAVGSRGRACLDLSRVRRHRKVGDRRVLGLAGAVRHDDPVAR